MVLLALPKVSPLIPWLLGADLLLARACDYGPTVGRRHALNRAAFSTEATPSEYVWQDAGRPLARVGASGGGIRRRPWEMHVAAICNGRARSFAAARASKMRSLSARSIVASHSRYARGTCPMPRPAPARPLSPPASATRGTHVYYIPGVDASPGGLESTLLGVYTA